MGVVSRGQLLDCGLDSAAVSRWTRAGCLHRGHPGVYAVGHREVPIRGRLVAALLYAGPGAALSHQTAGWWWKLLEATPQRIHATTPRDLVSLPDVRVHGRRSLEYLRHNGFPVTTPSQTLLDLAVTLRFADLRRALAEAYRQLLDPAESPYTCPNSPQPGACSSGDS